MRKGRRSAERLSYWRWRGWAACKRGMKACARMAMGLSLPLLMVMGWMVLPLPLKAQGPALTTISDTVYRADGSPAGGTVVISWPSFQTAEGDAVAAGNLSVAIGAAGALTVQLVPNVGASPAGTYYVAVFQLDDGTVRTEYWSVPATSPTTVGALLTTPGSGLANLAATQQYVNSAVANRALDSSVVHLAGTETIVGTKQFAASPSLPAPAGASDAATKGYVDAAVGSVGAGAYVPVAGGTMTGPLTLPADPSSPYQAADQHYVDSGLAAKADLVSGTVPAVELGSGVPSSGTCLTGNSTWGPCGGGAPAGITYATTGLNWSQTIPTAATAGQATTVTLTPCPVGIDTTSGAGYQVRLSGGGNSEAVNVLSAAGGCTSGAGSGTITFTPSYSYAAGYTIGSASSGIQETLNAGCGVNATSYMNNQCNVIIPANGPNASLNTYNIYGTIYLHSNQSTLSGNGTTLICMGRGPCLQVGDLKNSNDFTNNTVTGLSFRSPTNVTSNPSYEGVGIVQTQRTGQIATITTASAHGFRVGDMVAILFTDSAAYWGDAVITAVPSSTTFQYAHPGGDIAAQTTPGVVALEYAAILDNAENTHFIDVAYDKMGEQGAFNNFFDLWDDENVAIDHFNNQGISLNNNGNWTGSFVFSAGNQSMQVAPVITLRDSTITANYSNGLTVYNSNGVYVENTVLQATGPWQVYSSNTTGNYQGAYLKNIYSESAITLNPLSPARSPFPGLGIAGFIAGASSGAASFHVTGNGTPYGAFATGGAGTTPYSYFIVANDTTAGTQTSPMQVLNWKSTGSDSIPVRWPRVANGTDAITYDVIRMTTPAGIGGVFPYSGGCPGGAGGTCGYVAMGLTQSSACANTLVCSYTDSGSATTSSYTVKQANYLGALAFWPGSLVSVNKSVSVDVEMGNAVGVGLNGNPLQIARQCNGYGVASPGGYTACLASITSFNNAVPNQTATILTDGTETGGGMSLSKGRLNFSSTPTAVFGPHHIITLIDSQPGLTQATSGYRPPASANDTWIGTDLPSGGAALSAGQLAFGAPVSITNYIAQVGDGVHANWLERLNASVKEFNVPAKFDQSVTLTGMSNGCLNVVSGVIASTGSPCGSGSGGGSVSSIFGRSGVVVAASGDYSVSQVTGAAADANVVHNTGNETIGGTKTFATGSNLVLPQGAGFVPAVGGIGVDTTAGLPVVNLGGTTHQIAFTSSNISGQAGTALALAATPTQCSGAFATGIAANGNANCTTANVIQLSETAQPAGIPNWGVFWFDAASHSPRVIENNGQVMQLGLSNLFNTDPGGDPADNLEERNGTNAENLRVYSTYTNSTTWQRTSLGFDNADNYAVVRSENAASGSAPGLGLWIGSGLKWVVDASGNLKAWKDNQFNLGSDSGNAPQSVFAKTSFNSVLYGRNDFEIPNDGSTGTNVNQLAMFNGSNPSQAVLASAAATNVIGVVQGGAGKTGNAVISWHGYAYCIFDNPTTAGDAVVASTTTAGDCHDTGSGTQPASQLIGYVDVTNASALQTNGMRVSLQSPASGGGGSVTSVFGRTGAISAGTGDYSVAQVTGAAADSAVVHLAGTETITGAKTFTNSVTLNGNLNVAGNIVQTGTGPTQWSGQEWTGTSVTVPSGMAFSLGVGSDNAFKCQLSSGASCLPAAAPALPTCSWITEPTQSGTGNAFSGTNKAVVWGVYNPYPCVTNNVAYVVGTADNTANNYALGLYSGTSGGAGTLIATTAATPGTSFAAATGIKHLAWSTSNNTVPAGRVYIALTSNCTSGCAALLGTPGSGVTWAANIQVSVGTGGAALPASVTLPADSLSSGASIPSLIVY